MSKKPHTFEPAPASPARLPARPARQGPVYTLSLLLLLLLAGALGVLTHQAPAWMERLAAGEPDPLRRQRQDLLRLTRAALHQAPIAPKAAKKDSP